MSYGSEAGGSGDSAWGGDDSDDGVGGNSEGGNVGGNGGVIDDCSRKGGGTVVSEKVWGVESISVSGGGGDIVAHKWDCWCWRFW